MRDYYYVALGFFVVVLAALHFVSESRTGRAWRALREDPLAAEAMGIPVNRLKLMAFMFGAAVAGLTGTIFGAQGTGVFPQDFALSLLITVYACVILGGAGSIPGVVLGATIITVSLEVLREASEARVVFYALVLLAVIGTIRPWRVLAVTLAGTVVFGLVVHLSRRPGLGAWHGRERDHAGPVPERDRALGAAPGRPEDDLERPLRRPHRARPARLRAQGLVADRRARADDLPLGDRLREPAAPRPLARRGSSSSARCSSRS